MIIPESVKKLIGHLKQLPGVGPRQAARFAFHILHSPKTSQKELIETLVSLQKIKLCPQCNFPSFSEIPSSEKIGNSPLCAICTDTTRQKNILAVVERTTDVLSLERSGNYKGFYYVLGGNAFLNKNMDLVGLKKRVEYLNTANPPIEVIIATNPNAEGEATALYIEKELRNIGVTISRLGRGLPTGADLEYTDGPTLQNALEGRRSIK